MGRPRARAARRGARRASPRCIDVDPELVALTDSTTRGCAIVLAGLGLGGEDEIVIDRPGALRPHRPPCTHRARASSSTDGRRGAILAAVTPRTRLSRPRTCSGRRAGGSTSQRAARGVGRADARRRRAVGRRDPRRRERVRLLHRLRAEVAVRTGSDRRALRPRSRAPARRRRPAISRRRRTTPRARSSRRTGGARFDCGLDRDADARRPRRRARDASGVALRARGGDGRALPRAARGARRGRDAAGTLDARLVPAARRSRPSSSRRSQRAGRDRARAAGPQSRPRVVRLVDERGRPAAARPPAAA